MKMPEYKNSKAQKRAVENDRRTADIIRTFWAAASQKDKNNPEFLAFLMQCGWCNRAPQGRTKETTRRWRNVTLARYFGIKYLGPEELALSVRERWPKIPKAKAAALLNSFTGITHYYKPFRTAVIRFVYRNPAKLSPLFRKVSRAGLPPEKKVRQVVQAICELREIETPKGDSTSLLNAISPAFMCLDPQRRFPIMNQRTSDLLRLIGKEPDGDGAEALCRLIGQHGITNSFELDSYAQQALPKAPRATTTKTTVGKEIGYKSEEVSYARLSKQRKRIRKLHNKLINDFQKAVEWQYPAKYELKENKFDALIPKWKDGKRLLIEAKTSWSGPTGRSQVRQAIGQLFDYRKTHFSDEIRKIKLAVLLPSKPSADVIDLLDSLHIGVLWFNGHKLDGTFHL